MKRTTTAFVLALLALALCLVTPACAKPEKTPEKLSFGVFGEVLLYRDMQNDIVQQLLRRIAAIKTLEP